VDDQDGGQPGGNIRVGFLYNPARVSFVSHPGDSITANSPVCVAGHVELAYNPGRIDPSSAAFFESRKPLAGEFLFNGEQVFIIGLHFSSKGGDNPLFGFTQPPVLVTEAQRIQQAQVVNFTATLANIVAGRSTTSTSTVAGVPGVLGNSSRCPNESLDHVFEGNSVLDHS
jgi:predicted extracellular nuclease